MKLKEAKETAEEFVKLIKPYCSKIEVCGSVRRGREEVKDIDLVVLLRKKIPFAFLPNVKLVKGKEKLFEVKYKGKQVDVYVANEENFEVIKMIRTGSADFNRMLCLNAIQKGWRMKFDKGLIDSNGEILANTEKGILLKLMGGYIEPENRE